MNLEINKELVISTGHISVDTNTLLTNKNEWNYSADEFNYRLHINSMLDYYSEDLKGYEELIYLLVIARQNECKWLVLDGDGPTYMSEGLPYFEW